METVDTIIEVLTSISCQTLSTGTVIVPETQANDKSNNHENNKINKKQ